MASESMEQLEPYNILFRTPCESQDFGLYEEARAAGARAYLDLGREPSLSGALLRMLSTGSDHGIRVHAQTTLNASELPESISHILTSELSLISVFSQDESLKVIAEVCSPEEAITAEESGAKGLVVRGNECGGRGGELSSFLLLQHVLAATNLPVWLDGGVGIDTAAGAIWAGAQGVVLSDHFALMGTGGLPESTRAFLRKFDGSQTQRLNGYRFASQPGLCVHDKTDEELEAIPEGDDVLFHRVPVGQAAYQASSISAKYATIASYIREITDRVNRSLHSSDWMEALGGTGGLATSLGLGVPVVQGPMTRVSDNPEFAGAVQDAGALPFLALSLMREEQARTLLEATAARCKDGTWGVGILGFAPPEIRTAHLRLIEEYRPSAVLIAGGRPSQARDLEALGIEVFLHVPSAPLLEMFLKDGARNFVFEGRECGGHVGPRASLPLWQSQLDVLRTQDDLNEVKVLFAGGIHDSRSAAFIGAMASDLVERGLQTGVLMGTAYLFTNEAKNTGAIGAFYQDAVMGCAETALLETAPGHATRCVRTPYVDAFEAERSRLEASGASSSEIWEALEKLNLGRLRIASKGVERDGSKLQSVSESRQRDEGMVMVGQVATMRAERISLDTLHEVVSSQAKEFLKEREIELRALVERKRDDENAVAIIGMACIFPGSPDLESYWETILNGEDSVTEVPRERWNPDTYFDPDGVPGETTPSKWGGFLDPVAFDPLEYGIPPRSISAIEPVQLLSLQVAKQALEHAGYGSRSFNRERTSVIFGAEAGTDLTGGYGFRALFPQFLGEMPEALDEVLPSLTEDSFPGVLANVISGRIANRLDLGGVNFTVDAACASSLAALELAVKELRAGSSDMVLCGGADLHNSINDYLMFSSVHALSRKGRCTPFDADADGIALGEGVATVVLKRLSDAKRDGDQIFAVVNGISGASDGKSLGLTAPRKEGQVRALKRAYAQAQFPAHEVEMVEAHGTGTVVGDRTELGTLEQVFDGANTGSVVLGSVKSQIGHTKCTAGLAGLIKSTLAVHQGVQLPTLHIQKPNSGWDAAKSPFLFLDRPRPWTTPVRRAGVSAFGFGGTNFHAVVSSHEESIPTARTQWPSELFIFRGENRAEVLQHAGEMRAYLRAEKDSAMRDLAFEASRRGTGDVGVAFVASDKEELERLLDAMISGSDDEALHWRSESRDSLAFLMSGQGSQRVGMFEEFFVAFPELRNILEAGSEWESRLFPGKAFTPEQKKAQKACITDTRNAQPTLGMVDMAAYRLFGMVGVVPDMLAGHSYGEWPALCASGVIDLEQLLRISSLRASAILDSAGDDPGTMASVTGTENEVRAALEGCKDVVLANLNSPRQMVISGTTKGIDTAEEMLKAKGIVTRRFPVACAFHSPVIEGADTRFAQAIENEALGEMQIPVWSNTTAQPHENAASVRKAMAEHLVSPVRFVEQVEEMYASGARTFVECGPGRVQTGLVSKILGKRPHRVVTTEVPGEPAITSWLRAIASLFGSGVHIEPSRLFASRHCRRVDFSQSKQADTKSMSRWWVNGQTAWPEHGPLPKSAMKPYPKEPLMSAKPPAEDKDPQTQVVLEFFGSMREMIQAQRDVVLGYLGTAGTTIEISRESSSEMVSDAAVPARVEALAAAEPQVDAAVEVVERSIQEVLLDLVSERTGYPAEMIGLDMDLEGELSIDSIKRIEILGGLGEELGWSSDDGADRDALVEELAALKTLREIVAWIEANEGETQDAKPLSSDESSGNVGLQDAPVELPLKRFEMAIDTVEGPIRNGVSLQGKQFGFSAASPEFADALEQALKREGAQLIRLNGAVENLGALDGIIDFGTGERTNREVALFRTARETLNHGGNWLYAITENGRALSNDGVPSSQTGISGLLKTFAKEYPEARVRVLHLDDEESRQQQAERLIAELVSADRELEVGYVGGVRQKVEARPLPLGNSAALSLPERPVVLATGGARGITAQSLLGLAQNKPMDVIICGRSELPGAEAVEFILDLDRNQIREALIQDMGKEMTPALIERRCDQLLRQREMRGTVSRLEALGCSVEYVSIDVRDSSAFETLIDRLYTQYGRIDGVLHGAGVIEDKRIEQKEIESFQRVFETKVNPARVLAEKIRDDVSFVVFYSSVSGAFGNRGQVDYAAANATLDQIARGIDARVSGRVVSINWGPWGGSGMVSETLEREYARRGIGVIPPGMGVEAFLSELSQGEGAPSQVVWMCAEPEAMS